MKKSMKKYLILALVVAILATVAAFSVSAAGTTLHECSEHGWVQAVVGETVEAQCDSEGWTWLVCPESGCGAKIGKTDIIDPLGHKLVTASENGYTLSEDDSYYQHNLVCTRDRCTYTTIERNADEEAEIVKYCKVNFINNFVAVKFESKGFCPYASLAAVDEADAYETETETVYVAYPEAGDTTPIKAEGTPYRMADKYFGKYIFAGWLSEEEIEQVAAANTTATFSLRHDTNEIMKETQRDPNTNALIYTNKGYHDSLIEKADQTLDVISADTPADYDLYAIFEVDTKVEHEVRFYNYDGSLLYKVNVNHAIETAEYKGTVPPRKPDNVEFVYTFAHWELYGTTTQLSNAYDIDAVYADLKVMANYDSKIKMYNFRYFDKDGETPIMYGDNIAEEFVTIAGTGADRKNAEIGQQIKIDSYFDSAYDYVHTGKWLIPSRDNYVVDLKKITLPYGTLDSTKIDYIALVPQYQRYQRMYKLIVNVVYEDNPNLYNPEEIKLQVTNAEGTVIGYAEADKSSKYYKDGTYTVVFDVAYSPSYRVAVSSTGFSGTGTSAFHTFDPDVRDDDRPGNVLVTLTKTQGDPCNCICHTVFKPVWVGILNLLNSLFRLEFVCCDDMFANIGSELNYGIASR